MRNRGCHDSSAELWDELLNREYGPLNDGDGIDPYHHEEMARNYVGAISEALASWHGGQLPEQHYKDLAWGGPMGTRTYQQMSDLTPEDRERIAERNDA